MAKITPEQRRLRALSHADLVTHCENGGFNDTGATRRELLRRLAKKPAPGAVEREKVKKLSEALGEAISEASSHQISMPEWVMETYLKELYKGEFNGSD